MTKTIKTKNDFRKAAACGLAILAFAAGAAQAAEPCIVTEHIGMSERVYDFDLETVTFKSSWNSYGFAAFGAATIPMGNLSAKAQQKIEQVRQQLPAACKTAAVLK